MASAIAVIGLLLVAGVLGWLQRRQDRLHRPAVRAPDTPAMSVAIQGEAPPAESLLTGNPLDTPAPPVTPAIRLRDGIACLALFVLAQWVAAFGVAIVVAVRGVPGGRAQMLAAVYRAIPVIVLLAEAAGAIVLVIVLRRLAHRVSWEALKTEMGLRFGNARTSALAFAGGLALSLAAMVCAVLAAKHTPAHLGFTMQMLARTRTGRLAWSVVAVLMAGPIEEVLFRGILLTAFTKVARTSLAGVASALAFWLFHMPRVSDFWPAGVFVALFAAFATVLRLRTRSLGPPVAAHVGYNLVIALIVLRAG